MWIHVDTTLIEGSKAASRKDSAGHLNRNHDYYSPFSRAMTAEALKPEVHER